MCVDGVHDNEHGTTRGEGAPLGEREHPFTPHTQNYFYRCSVVYSGAFWRFYSHSVCCCSCCLLPAGGEEWEGRSGRGRGGGVVLLLVGISQVSPPPSPPLPFINSSLSFSRKLWKLWKLY